MDQRHYYHLAQEGSQQIDGHPGLVKLQQLCHQSENILDVGCGEGTRLNTLLSPNQSGIGVDINHFAIKQAHLQYPRHQFVIYDGKKLPFPDEKFDLVYSAFVLEHTQNPKQFVDEMIRVLQPGGKLVVICPNFGAPNRRSPNSIERPITKLITGFFNDISDQTHPISEWTAVEPRKIYRQIDDDTTIEPYLLSLLRYLSERHLLVKKSSSLWSLESFSLKFHHLLFRFLGILNLYPFKFWGPQLFVISNKI